MMTTDYVYTDSAGVVLGTITRVDDGTAKTFRASKGFPNPRPLYGLHLLAERLEAPVLVVEGEKTADAAAELLPDFVVVTSPFGAKSAGKADWSVLKGREVTIWPDNDEAGAGYAAAVLRRVPHAKLVELPAFLRDGWDLADVPTADITPDIIAELIAVARRENVVEFPGKKKKGNGAKAIMQQTAEAVGAKARNLVNPPGDPMPNARLFIAEKYDHPDRPLLVQQGGMFYRWDGTCWPALEDASLRSQLYKWLSRRSALPTKALNLSRRPLERLAISSTRLRQLPS
jgi:DNA primase